MFCTLFCWCDCLYRVTEVSKFAKSKWACQLVVSVEWQINHRFPDSVLLISFVLCRATTSIIWSAWILWPSRRFVNAQSHNVHHSSLVLLYGMREFHWELHSQEQLSIWSLAHCVMRFIDQFTLSINQFMLFIHTLIISFHSFTQSLVPSFYSLQSRDMNRLTFGSSISFRSAVDFLIYFVAPSY